MTKYIKQTDTYSCGPIAIMNALIFQGLTQNDLETIGKIVNCKPPNGTKIKPFSILARSLGFTRIYKPTIEKLHEILDRGDAVILNHGDRGRRHYSLIIGYTTSAYSIVNHYHGPTLNPVHKSTFLKDIWRQPKLWLVKNLQQKTQGN